MASYVLRRVDDRVWAAFRLRAAKEGVTVTDLIMRLIRDYLARPEQTAVSAKD